MKNSQNQQNSSSPIHRHLPILFAYYCKLNPHKLKHKNFDDVDSKAQTMDLHEFMTFCKDFRLIAKQHKNDKPTANLQEQPSKQQNTQNAKPKSTLHIDLQSINLEEETNQVEAEHEGHETKSNYNEFIEKNQNNNQDNNQQLSSKPPKTIIKTPTKYLSEKRLALIFKKIASPEETLSFTTYQRVMQSVANLMYEELDATQQGQQKNKKVYKQKENNKIESVVHEQSHMEDLLAFLGIDSQQNAMNTFRTINERHGNLEHLALLRSPLKKLNIKNNPLGKYAGIENQSHSRLVQSIKKQEKINSNSTSQLPSIAPKKWPIKSQKNSLKTVDKQNFQAFLTKNKNKIQTINKTYESRAQVKFAQLVPPYPKIDEETAKTDSYANKSKKYSERHKDRIIGNTASKQLGRLIEASQLYNDDIFNKYLQINYTPRQEQIKKLANSRLAPEK